jgi:hypothetical protein
MTDLSALVGTLLLGAVVTYAVVFTAVRAAIYPIREQLRELNDRLAERPPTKGGDDGH